ncbi:MAG TPA: permease [Pilimelia sp.]|nr:permease [Pilimelia sp.]
MARELCSSCGRPMEAGLPCPHCGNDPSNFATDLAQIEREISEMSAQDVALQAQRTVLSRKMQAAMHRRALMANAQAERMRRAATKTKRGPTHPVPPAPPGRRPRTPRQEHGPLGEAPPPPPPPAGGGPPAAAPPEASSRSVQNILLGLGGFVLGIAAIVFAGVAISTLDAISRATILIVATAVMLFVPRRVARRGLTATAETVAAVGLVLVPIDGYALWTVRQLNADAMPGTLFAGLVFAVTAFVAAAYARTNRLTVPRYVAVLAVQPILPLVAYEWINGPAGWALVLTAVAALDLAIARSLPTRLAAWTGTAPAPPADVTESAPARPEGAPEEPDTPLTVEGEVIRPARPDAPPGDDDEVVRPAGAPSPEIIDVSPGPPAAPPRSARPAAAAATAAPGTAAQPSVVSWLPATIWVLHGVALGAALVYAAAAVATAESVPSVVRAALVLLLAAAVGLAGALSLRRQPLPDIAGAVMTLAIIVSAGRVAAVALPGRAMVVIAAVVAVTGIFVRALPATARRGPQFGSAIALAVIGVVVAGDALRAAIAPIRTALPAWSLSDAELEAYSQRLADAVGPAGWQVAISALLLTVAAALALPAEIRRESAVTGATLAALSAPASLGMDWYVGPWVLALAAAVIAAAGLLAPTIRGARAHAIGGGVAGLAAAGASVVHPGITAAVLTSLAIAAMVIAAAARMLDERPAAAEIELWAVGGAAFALPGAVATVAVTLAPPTTTPAEVQAATAPVLAVGFLAVCMTLGYAAMTLVADRHISPQLSAGASLGALAVTAAAFGAPGATVADAWIGALVMVAAILLFLAPSIDAGRRADRLLDGPDFAAAAVTAASVASLARVVWLLAPGIDLVAPAVLVLVFAVGIRALPEDWRRGPTLGVTLSGAVVAAIAGFACLRWGLQAIAVPGALWNADVGAMSTSAGPDAWQAPVALVLMAFAAAIVLPRPTSYDVEGVLVVLATIGTPIALGLPWWSPIIVGGAVAAGYSTTAVLAIDPRAARTRTVVAAVVALHAAVVGLARPWSTAAALLLIALLGAVVATMARLTADLVVPTAPDGTPAGGAPAVMPPHLAQIGGAALAGSLLAMPGAVAALAAGAGHPAEVVLGGALASTSLGLAVVAAARRTIPQYLPYATLGVAGGATAAAIAALPTDEPYGVYAAAAALLGVISELLRENTPNPAAGATVRRWSIGTDGPVQTRRAVVVSTPNRWAVSPPMGALAVAALPGALALASIAPALAAALVDPFATLEHRWQGPPEILLHPTVDVDGTAVIAALLLTIAAALAAVGFTGGGKAQAFPVVLPGVAVTLLITPIALRLPWPAATHAALVVFAVSMLGLALTPPPPPTERARPLHVTRLVVFLLGLAAGNAGLLGSLATESLTLFTLGGAVLVGLTAALFGRTQNVRIMGWLFAAVMAQLFVLTAGLVLGLDRRWSAFGVLGVGAILLVISATLPRLSRPEAIREAAAVEWSGYAAALLAVALAFDSAQHIAGLLAAWGAVLGVSATRAGRRPIERRILFWTAVGFEIAAWWLMMSIADVALPEAYTLPFAALALLVGVLERQHRPDLDSWTAYGPALIAAFLPSLIIVFTTETSPVREVLLLLGAVATLIAGSMRQQRAPVVVGGVVTAVTALHALTVIGTWLVLIPVGVFLLVVGASYEKRRRDLQRLRGALNRMQ